MATWNKSIGNKLLEIKPTIGEYRSVVRNIRKEEVVLARIRLVHTRVTHSYCLVRSSYNVLIVLHRLLYVTFYWRVAISYRQEIKCFHVDNMKQIFQDIHIDSIMTFLKEINLFNKILILLFFFKIVSCQLNMLFLHLFKQYHWSFNAIFCSCKERVQLSENQLLCMIFHHDSNPSPPLTS